MTGPTLSLKTTTARLISRFLRVNLVETGYIKDYPPEEATKSKTDKEVNKIIAPVRDFRHECLKEIFKIYLMKGLSVILDSAFSKREIRKKYYTIIENNNLDKKSLFFYRFLLVWYHCDDREIIKHRLGYRKTNPLISDPSVIDWSVINNLRKDYQLPIDENHYDRWPHTHELIEILEFDSSKKIVKLNNKDEKYTPLGKNVRDFLKSQLAIGKL